MEPDCPAISLTPAWKDDKVFLVRAVDAIRLCRDGGYEALGSGTAISAFEGARRGIVHEVRGFVARARLTSFPLSSMEDAAVIKLIASQLKGRNLIALHEVDPSTASGQPANLRRLVRAIESKTRGRLSYSGRQYRLVADASLATLPGRDNYQVTRQDEARQVLDALAKQPSTPADVRPLLGEAREAIAKDWRPPLQPDGLVLLRRIITMQAASPDLGPALTPSQMKKLVSKTDWIEVEVVDQDGEPYTGGYRLELPDNSTAAAAGTFDDQGFFGDYEIDSGTYKLSLLDRKTPKGAAVEEQANEADEAATPGAVAVEVPVVLEAKEFSVTVVDELGQPVADMPLLFQSGGASLPAATNGGGVAKCTVPATDSVQVVFASVDALAQLMKPIWASSRGVERKDWVKADATTTVVTLFGGEVVKVIANDATTVTTRPKETLKPFFGVQTTPEKPATLTVQPLVIMVRMLGEHFDIDKCFLLPKSLDSVQKLVRLHRDYKLTDLLIVGHTDTSSTDEHNLALSVERTSAMHAYLTDDGKSWLPWYNDDKPASKRWGTTEDTHMIETLMGGAATVLGYQQWHNAQDPQKQGCEVIKKVDGKIGPETRLQLILDYMHREDTTVPDETSIQVHGCGEFFTLDKTEEGLDPSAPDNKHEQRNRRVEVFLFPKEIGILPPAPGEKAKKGEKEYPEWRLRSVDYDLLSIEPADDILARWIGWGPQGGNTQPNLVLADLGGKELLSATPTVYTVPNFDGVCQRFDLSSAPPNPNLRFSTMSDDNPAIPPVVLDLGRIVASLLDPQGLGQAVTVERLNKPKQA